ncbi:fibronectin type III domain-containing protein [Candidatus Nomurabacteria bacterium]|nr:fibronectin type III domain-containing protein [Candidatus Nomurabacteria bacterium]
MYITPRQKRRYLVTSILLVIAIPVTVVAIYFATQWLSSAGQDKTPQEVAISNLTTNSLTVTWVTGKKTNGSIIVVKDKKDSSPVIDTRGADTRKTHFVELVSLEPDTDYTFKIVSDGEEFTSEGNKNFKFHTAPLTDETPVPKPVYGKAKGLSADDAIIFVFVSSPEESLPVSAVPSATGNWIVDLSSLKSTDGSSSVSVSSDTEVTVIVQGADDKGAVETGTYSDVFDDSGELKESVDLTVDTGIQAFVELPSQSKITEVIASSPGTTTGGTSGTSGTMGTTGSTSGSGSTGSGTTGSGTTSGTTGSGTSGSTTTGSGTTSGTSGTTTGTTGSTTSGTTSQTPEPAVPTFDPASREFLITLDINWKNLVLGAQTTKTTPDVTTGADSLTLANHTDTGFSVVWLSDSPVEGYVKYGTVQTTLNDEAIDIRDSLVEKGKYYSHIIEVDDLTPETTYFYEVYSGSEIYKNSGSPFTLTTFATLDSPPPFVTVAGNITGLDDYTDAVVMLQLADKDNSGSQGKSGYAAVVPDASGAWIASVGDLRPGDGSEYYSYSDNDEVTASTVTYADSTTDTKKTTDFDNLSLAIEITPPEDVSDYQRVNLLSDYNISSSQIATVGVGGGGPTVGDTYLPSGSTTPKTADSSSLFIGTGAGIIAIFIGIRLVRKNEYREKKGMASSI